MAAKLALARRYVVFSAYNAYTCQQLPTQTASSSSKLFRPSASNTNFFPAQKYHSSSLRSSNHNKNSDNDSSRSSQAVEEHLHRQRNAAASSENSSTSPNLSQDQEAKPESKPEASAQQNSQPSPVAPWEQKRSVSEKLKSAVVAVPRHIVRIPEYLMIIGSKIIEVSKGFLWALRHPILAKEKVSKGWRHHVVQPFKLMWVDIKVANKIRKLAKSEDRPFTELEKRRLQAIGADFLRFVPFAFFLAIPALELLLPVYLFMFPGAKPGWFESRDEKDVKLRRKLETRLEMAKFMKASIETYEVKKQRKGEVSLSQFKVLHKKLKNTVGIEELQKYVPLFNTHLSLEKLDQNNLKSMCHLLHIRTPPGIMSSNFWLRYLLTQRMDKLRKQDEEFRARGVEQLTDEEIIQSNVDRGGRGVGVTRQQLNENLDFWIQMNYEYRLPIALILYTRAAHILPDPKTIVEKAKEPVLTTVPTKSEAKLKEIRSPKSQSFKAASASAGAQPAGPSSQSVSDEDLASEAGAVSDPKLDLLSTITFTVMQETVLEKADLELLYGALEEVNDMVLIRDVSDDLKQFKIFLEDEHLEGSKKRRNDRLTKQLSKLNKEMELIQEQTLKDKKDMLDDETLKDAVIPDGLDNDGFILEEDFILILQKILPDEARFGKLDDAFITQLTTALNPHNNKHGIQIQAGRVVLKKMIEELNQEESKSSSEEEPGTGAPSRSLFQVASEMALRT